MTNLRWPPPPPPGPGGFRAAPVAADLSSAPQVPLTPLPPAGPAGLAGPGTDGLLAQSVAEVHAAIASHLEDGAAPDTVLPLIRDAVRTWAERRVRAGAPVPSPADREALAQAVYDQRYGLGPLATFLRDPEVENVDINGCDQVWVTYATGEREIGRAHV